MKGDVEDSKPMFTAMVVGSSKSGATAVTALRQYVVRATTVKATQNSQLKPLYLDVQATTPMDPRVVDAMIPYMVSAYGNPHSKTHFYGWEAEEAVEKARLEVAKLIGADSREIIFTSGATESNNIAIKGVANFYKETGKNHVITVQTVRRAQVRARFLSSLINERLQNNLFTCPEKWINQFEGKLSELENAITDETILVSIMVLNNEIGVIQPTKEIGKLCREKKVFFHCDGAQAVGKISIDVNDMNIDLMSISGHKIYGPKGIGAIYVRRRPRVRLEPQMSGGGQERGMRSGTLPTPLIVGFGKACAIAAEEMEMDKKHIERLSKRLLDRINSKLSHVVRNGDPERTYQGCLNLSFSCVEGESLLMGLKNVALSSGSACTSASLEPSYVLRAIGAEEDLAHSSIRFGIGRFTTEEEIDYTADLCIKEVERLREMSPLWEMIQEGTDLKSIEWSQH
ncbi:cysteine desulfurase [Onchocerca flexuosa]|uniref:cysteine desulfurase n=1 Tax=Onchocerca flexuosa TaxID=387005 RepID=A0A238C6E2_9BILA|nr:cysteine desulfurase [Onchocerca flexuosa]